MARRFTLPPWLVAAFILASGGGIVALAAQAATDAPAAVYWSDGDSGRLPDGTPVDLVETDIKAARTHWDMLLERRTRDELEELLQERLDLLRARRGGGERLGA